jgi:hypothetical protein
VAIPKKYKKQIKAAMAGQPSSTVIKKSAEKTKRKKTWSLKIGDLVENGDDCALIIQSDERGSYLLLSSGGREWVRATKIRRVQKAPGFSGACKPENKVV